MIQIRKNTFETNSSSTHSLAVAKSAFDNPIDEELFLKSYDIDFNKDIFTDNNQIVWCSRKLDGYKITDIEDKLIYTVNILLMDNSRLDEETPAGKLYKLLKECFPNTNLSFLDDYNLYDYRYEDGDCWFLECSDWKQTSDINVFLDKNNLKYLMQYGTIYFGNRDDYEPVGIDFPDYIREKVMDKENNLFAETSG